MANVAKLIQRSKMGGKSSEVMEREGIYCYIVTHAPYLP